MQYGVGATEEIHTPTAFLTVLLGDQFQSWNFGLWKMVDGEKNPTLNTSYFLFHIYNIKFQFFFDLFPLEDFLQYLASRSEMSELKSFSLDFCLC